MGRKKRGIPGLSFSWKRALGISAAKGRLSQRMGVPLTRQGRQRKAGALMGCALPLIAAAFTAAIGTLVACSSPAPTTPRAPAATIPASALQPTAVSPKPTATARSVQHPQPSPTLHANASTPRATASTASATSTPASALTTRTVVATSEPRSPTATPPRAVISPTAVSRTAKAGVQSETPAGSWVTSSYRTAKYYYAASDPRWKELSPQYRVWFDTKEDLLAAYPDRQPAP